MAPTTVAVKDGDARRLISDKDCASGVGLIDHALLAARPDGAHPGPKGLVSNPNGPTKRSGKR